MDQQPCRQRRRPGLLMPALWVVAALLGTLLAAAGVGLAAYRSESGGVSAAMVAAFPVGLLWTGALAALVVQLLRQEQLAVRLGVPLGCGLVGGVALLLLCGFFFVAIFPRL